MSGHRILVVDDEPGIAAALKLLFGEKGYKVKAAGSAAAALALMQARSFDLVFTDLRLPDSVGIDVLERVKVSAPGTQVILMTAHGSTEIAIDAIKRGAFYYVEKPFTPGHALTLAERALQYVAVKRENRARREAIADDGETFGVIGRDARMRHIRGMIRTAAPSDASVLIEGESGTGKE